MHHNMRLYDHSFEQIERGDKTLEIRLFDRKRQCIGVGDRITFNKMPHHHASLEVCVTELLICDSFEELLSKTDLSEYGHPVGYTKKDILDSLYQIYSPEDEKRYGVIGIRMKLSN